MVIFFSCGKIVHKSMFFSQAHRVVCGSFHYRFMTVVIRDILSPEIMKEQRRQRGIIQMCLCHVQGDIRIADNGCTIVIHKGSIQCALVRYDAQNSDRDASNRLHPPGEKKTIFFQEKMKEGTGRAEW